MGSGLFFIITVTDTNFDSYPIVNLNYSRLFLILPKKKYVVYFIIQTLSTKSSVVYGHPRTTFKFTSLVLNKYFSYLTPQFGAAL